MNNLTIKEHYIPRVYLNGFASRDERIYFYDLKTYRYSNQLVPVKTVCYKKNLYEYRNENNELIYTNSNEKALNNLETMFSKKRTAIRTRIRITNPKTTCFLSEEEIAFWITYIVIQIFRLPKVIDEITYALRDMIPSTGDANLHRNTALYILLPLLKKLDSQSTELKLYNEFISIISTMRCTIGYDGKHRLITSDSPIYLYAPKQRIQDCLKIYFPIDSSLCLIFTKDELYPDNGIMLLNDYEYENIFKSIVYAADDKLYLSREFTRNELRWIKSARIDKDIDNKQP